MLWPLYTLPWFDPTSDTSAALGLYFEPFQNYILGIGWPTAAEPLSDQCLARREPDCPVYSCSAE